MHRIATVVLAAAVLSTGFLADADAGPFRHRRSCRPSACGECYQPANACGECCQPTNACGEADIPPCVLYVCEGGSYKNVGPYSSASAAHDAGMRWKTGKDALQYRPHDNLTTPCNKTFTIKGFCLDASIVLASYDLFYCDNSNTWAYQGTFPIAQLARQYAKNHDNLTVEATCPPSGSPGPGQFTICATGNSVNGTPCMRSEQTPGAKQSEPKHP
jgi:hypothetical protein